MTSAQPPAAPPPLLTLQVSEIVSLTPTLRQFRLVAPDGGALPRYAPGDHLRVQVTLADGRRDWRHYSLLALAPQRLDDTAEAPRAYVIAVLLEPAGRGGSRFMHEQLAVGDGLTVQGPWHEFPLQPGAGRVVLLAGGIGVTPLTAMAAHCVAQGRPLRFHYAARTPQALALAPALQAWLGEALRLHADSQAAGPLDLQQVLDDCGSDDPLYVCGPRPLLDAVLAAARARGWAEGRVRFELFSAQGGGAGDHAFEVCLAQSGRRFEVPPQRSILDVLIEQGCDPLYDCRRGECGVCAVPVLEGRPDHRDLALTESEKASGRLIQICVSRSHSPCLVLDL